MKIVIGLDKSYNSSVFYPSWKFRAGKSLSSVVYQGLRAAQAESTVFSHIVNDRDASDLVRPLDAPSRQYVHYERFSLVKDVGRVYHACAVTSIDFHFGPPLDKVDEEVNGCDPINNVSFWRKDYWRPFVYGISNIQHGLIFIP